MFEPFAPAIGAFAKRLAGNYREVFGKAEPDHAHLLRAVAKPALERIAATDAPHHDALHTLAVAEVGQAILRGRAMVEPVSRECWLHLTVATLLHDVGYLRGVCPGDGNGRYVVDAAGDTVAAPRGATDAFLAPWHVERAKIFVRRRCAAVPALDVERLCRAIELTRFPVPEDGDHAETDTEAGLVRAADLVGQLADPAYPRKLAALYHELRETGVAERLGYRDPADLAEQYPRFFWGKVEPYVGPALGHLERTAAGRLWVAQLYAHVFVEEHLRHRLGTERGVAAAGGGELRVVQASGPGDAGIR
ncbi:MAG TPA: hypothetical protein VF606_06665 [Geminicoccaceae bacterium]